MINMKVGDRIYYTGDMAGTPDYGVITAIYNNIWGNFVNIILDDGREFRKLYRTSLHLHIIGSRNGNGNGNGNRNRNIGSSNK